MFIYLFFFLSSFLFAETNYTPKSYFLLERDGYTISYDGRTKNALWVYEKLTAASCTRSSWQNRCVFRADPTLPKAIRAELKDFAKSGYHRGHLCPYADLRCCSTYLLSNLSPQLPEFNQGIWKRLEEYTRSLTKRFAIVHVITLPLFLPDPGTEHISYKVIGKKSIAVPTHFCKVVYAEQGIELEIFAFIIPHQPLPKETPLSAYRTSLDEVERLSGVLFHRPRIELSK